MAEAILNQDLAGQVRALSAGIHQPLHDPHGESLGSFIRVRDEIRARLVPAVRAALGLEENRV
jgi:protein-tyrosine-phosphatase